MVVVFLNEASPDSESFHTFNDTNMRDHVQRKIKQNHSEVRFSLSFPSENADSEVMKREKTFSEMLSEMMKTPSENPSDIDSSFDFAFSFDAIDPTFSTVHTLPKRPSYPRPPRRTTPTPRLKTRVAAELFLSGAGLSESEQRAVGTFSNWGEPLLKDGALALSTLKKAYRRLAKSFHPDLGGSRADAGEFRRLHEAYRLLMGAFEKKKAAEAASSQAA